MRLKKLLGTVLLVLLLGAVAAAVYYLYTVSKVKEETLKGSGTVEVTEVVISPEIGGRVAEVMVKEGESVKAGVPLFRLNDEILQAQRKRAAAAMEMVKANQQAAQVAVKTAQAAVETSRAQFDQALNAARLEESPGREKSWQEAAPADFSQPAWYFNKQEEITAAQAEVKAARDCLEQERSQLEKVLKSASNADLSKAETRLAQARAAFLVAKDVLDRVNLQNEQKARDAAQSNYDAAKSELDAAQSDYDRMLSDKASEDVLEARARLAVADERYRVALDRWNKLLTGDNALKVRTAEATLHQAEANVNSAQAAVSQTEKAIAQAQSELDLIDTQIAKMVVKAPSAGVVMTRSIEVGEIIQPGTPAMTIGKLDELTITVYVPENLYGQLKLGQSASVNVDSFPGETFDATITRIADRAEFTPRNVQTTEGRRTTVFAVKLAVKDPQAKLKPGMPADVSFDVTLIK